MSGKKGPKEKEPSDPKDDERINGESRAPLAGAEIPEKDESRVEEREESKKYDELLTKMKYLQAEFENYQKRAYKEKQDIITGAHERLLTSLLPILDDFDKAVELSGSEDSGLGIMLTKLRKTLDEFGLNEIPGVGTKFDAFLHEAVNHVRNDELEDGTIESVVQKGYRCNLKVIRPSLVVVVKNEGEKDA